MCWVLVFVKSVRKLSVISSIRSYLCVLSSLYLRERERPPPS